MYLPTAARRTSSVHFLCRRCRRPLSNFGNVTWWLCHTFLHNVRERERVCCFFFCAVYTILIGSKVALLLLTKALSFRFFFAATRLPDVGCCVKYMAAQTKALSLCCVFEEAHHQDKRIRPFHFHVGKDLEGGGVQEARCVVVTLTLERKGCPL